VTRKKVTAGSDQELKLIDNLILKLFEAINKDIDDNPKIGSFIKMVELKHKLAPVSAAQDKIWSMLEKVRKKALESDDAARPTSASNGRKKRSAKDIKP